MQRGHRSSVAPRSISLVLPGSDYKANDLEQFQRQATAEGDMSLMEIAWAVASEDPRPHTLPELSALLFDSTTAASLYVTYVMLQRDVVYFKQVGAQGGAGMLHVRAMGALRLAVLPAMHVCTKTTATVLAVLPIIPHMHPAAVSSPEASCCC
jgi:hypothetical protein